LVVLANLLTFQSGGKPDGKEKAEITRAPCGETKAN
jgi:hypothetical protein